MTNNNKKKTTTVLFKFFKELEKYDPEELLTVLNDIRDEKIENAYSYGVTFSGLGSFGIWDDDKREQLRNAYDETIEDANAYSTKEVRDHHAHLCGRLLDRFSNKLKTTVTINSVTAWELEQLKQNLTPYSDKFEDGIFEVSKREASQILKGHISIDRRQAYEEGLLTKPETLEDYADMIK